MLQFKCKSSTANFPISRSSAPITSTVISPRLSSSLKIRIGSLQDFRRSFSGLKSIFHSSPLIFLIGSSAFAFSLSLFDEFESSADGSDPDGSEASIFSSITSISAARSVLTSPSAKPSIISRIQSVDTSNKSTPSRVTVRSPCRISSSKVST